MNKIQLGARIILGLIYFVFGGMGLGIALGLMQMPEQQLPDAAATFMQGIMATGYFFPLLKVTEALCGLLLLIGVAAPLALVIIAPVTLHIILYHIYLMPVGPAELAMPVGMGLAQIIAMSAYWDLYKPLFGKRKR